MRGPGPHGATGLKAAAEALGITPDELKTELEAGKSIAQVAEEKDIDVQDGDRRHRQGGTRAPGGRHRRAPRPGEQLVEREGLPKRPEGGPRATRPDDGPGCIRRTPRLTTTAS